MKTKFLTLALLFSAYYSKAQNIEFTDVNFGNFVVSQSYINTNNDAFVTVQEANAYTGGINCDGYNIQSLADLSYFPNISALTCSNNLLTELNVSMLSNLVTLGCAGNQLTELDVSSNPLLVNLYCNDNLLTTLNLANGNNTNFQTLSANNNPNLTCIQVDNVAYSQNNWVGGNFVYNANILSTDCSGQNCIVNTPDPIFYQLLIDNGSIDTNNDGHIQCSEAAAFNGTLNVSYQSITDLIGIEAFTTLKYLYCAGNQLTNLDVSQNAALEVLVCGFNPNLTTLNLSNNGSLTAIAAMNNNLNTVNLANGANSLITGIDFSNNPNLTCIQVDDADYSDANWTGENFLKPSGCDFSEDCSSVVDPVPAAPTNLSATVAFNPLSVSLTWVDNASNENGFSIQKSTDGTAYTFVANVTENVTSYVDNNVSPNLTYYYRVFAFNVAEDSDFSNVASVSTGSVGIAEDKMTPISLYPNPTQNFLFVNVKTAFDVETIQICDALGRKLSDFNWTENQDSITVDVSKFSNGLYWISLNGLQPTTFQKQ